MYLEVNMSKYHETGHGVLYCRDCLDVLKQMADESVDSIVTDPPYGLSFMGKKWDYDVPSVEMWRECLRVLKPGGHLLSFAGTRTQHRMAVRIEDAGFEIRDMLAWIYGSGFPKSLNLGNGWGTALKPAFEPITVARKPISEKTVAANVLMHGTGGINIDGCRVGSEEISVHNAPKGTFAGGESERGSDTDSYQGRFPANLIHDGSDEVLAVFPNTGKSAGGRIGNKGSALNMCGNRYECGDPGFGDSGSAARFFYCAKASKAERNAGCDELTPKQYSHDGGNKVIENAYQRNESVSSNHHPTVKPIAVMQWLCRLVTPPNGTVLDPFLGSGTTAMAAIREGFRYIGIEREQEYCDIAAKRIESELEQEAIAL
jgi:site-specific DNA-methyltransferase (adenine-specific)